MDHQPSVVSLVVGGREWTNGIPSMPQSLHTAFPKTPDRSARASQASEAVWATVEVQSDLDAVYTALDLALPAKSES